MTTRSCGVAFHPTDCLCDVVVANPVPIMNINFARDYFNGPRIWNALDIGVPAKDSEILAFFEKAVEVKEAFEIAERVGYFTDESEPERLRAVRHSSKIDVAMRIEMGRMMQDGKTNFDISLWLKTEHNTKVSPSYLSRLRRDWGMPPSGSMGRAKKKTANRKKVTQ